MTTFIVLKCGTIQVTGSWLELAIVGSSIPLSLVKKTNLTNEEVLKIVRSLPQTQTTRLILEELEVICS